jgi:hypothetical protein
MARKIITASKKAAPVVAAKAPVAAPTVTAVRNSAVPPKSGAIIAKKMAPTYDQIALTAYYIWKGGKGGTPDENWLRAERELRGM